ncbi:MAG: sarcosine oxidase subunit alpha family protein [Pseudomonadota bacterium]
MTAYRLPASNPSNAVIRRDKSVFFTFDGQQYMGLKGDTLASALSANDVRLVGRSFKYHRPRGLFSAGPEEPSALMTVGEGAHREPNSRATMVELFDGLKATSQNRWPSLKHDLAAVNGMAGNLLSAGFYYKTFMGPSRDAWMIYEHFIRKAAGMGAGSFEPDPDTYEHMHGYCDVLVVGAGPAGLAAATQAANSGASVYLCEDNPQFGGSLLGDFSEVKGKSAPEWASDQIDALKNNDTVTLFARTTVYGAFDDMTFGALERLTTHDPNPAQGQARMRHWTIRAKQIIVATGRIDRPIVFPGNDVPGVMLLDGVHRHALKYAVAMGKSVSVFANHDGAYGAIADLAKAGVGIANVIDPRPTVTMDQAELVRQAGADLIKGAVVCGTTGGRALKSIKVSKWENGLLSGGSWGLECDCLAVSGGTTPLIHLASQSGARPRFDEAMSAFVMPGPLPEGWHSAGGAFAEFEMSDAIRSGTRAGSAAAKALGLAPKRATPVSITGIDFSLAPDKIMPLWEVPKSASGSKQKAFVDLQHDVTADDIRLAEVEGFHAAEHLKRYTTLGMAADQGKTSNVNGMAIMAHALGTSIEEVGTTRFRPPYIPVTLGAIAGENVRGHLQPTRKTPMHDWHIRHNAEMMNVGLWKRPRVYYKPGETLEQAYVREAQCVRASVGICDVSTLGKIDVQGPDAGEFLNRLYTNGFAKLPVGKARYGLMLRHDGLLFDDGTTWRLSETQYLTTTTTANAATVMAHMEYYLSVWWPDLKVRVSSMTDNWAAASLAGPNARKVLASVTDFDVSDAALPFMGVTPASIDGIYCLIARLSFSGELAFEIFWPACHGDTVWRRLMDAGTPYEITPYGIEALGTLRIEKGHIAGGELDGRVTADDVGLSAMCSTKKDFIGKALMTREALLAEDRIQLVGLVSQNDMALKAGSHLVINETAKEPAVSEGHVSSVTYSPVMEKYIALGLLKGGRDRHGETLYVTDPLNGTHIAATVTDPIFYDKAGEKMRG